MVDEEKTEKNEEKENSDVEEFADSNIDDDDIKEKENEEKNATEDDADNPESEEIVEDTEDEDIVEEIDIEDSKYADIDVDDEDSVKSMLMDFSEMEDFDVQELIELQSAMEEVKESVEGKEKKEKEIEGETEEQKLEDIDEYPGWGMYGEGDFQPAEISDELREKINRELEEKRKKEKVRSEAEFKEYCKNKKTKIWYHALWFLIFEMEDHQATKKTLYDALKEVTSKSAIDPIEEHKFYFGLGFILRLSMMGEKVVLFDGERLKINKMVGVDLLTDILVEVGEPISERPTISEDKKKEMFLDFLTDDFSDI
ncbi:MAG: hypothetical protein GF364_03280 [Candidatus Lokiarchaeota archaeon]|nr:hypothetical protein [Candidatus Lokiarchaeota archaeon]